MGHNRGVGPRQAFRNILQLAVLILLVCAGRVTLAQRPQRVIEDLIRRTAKVADNVPLAKIDGLIEDMGKSRAAREAVDAELRGVRRAAGASGAARGLSRADEALGLLRKATRELDPSVIRRLEQLDERSREAALVMARGGEHLQVSLPDIAARGSLLREGGAETVATIGTFGPDAARAAMRLDEAIRGGSLAVRGGSRAITVADFGRVMTRHGDASWSFWRSYVQPHWKVWLGSGALAAYLANPEAFQDAAGHLTESGFRALTEFVGEVVAAAIRGTGRGTADAVDRVTGAVSDTLWSGVRSRSAVIGTALFLATLALCFWKVRSRLARARGMSPRPSEAAGPGQPKPVS